MRYLLDTHTLLWARSAPDRLSQDALAVLESADNALYVSAATLWECAIKSAIGKLDIPAEFYRIVSDDYTILGIEVAHLEAYGILLMHHNASPCRNSFVASWNESPPGPPSTRGCEEFEAARKQREPVCDRRAFCAPVMQTARDGRRRCVRACRGFGRLGARREMGGIHARREFSGRPGVGVGRGEQHSAPREMGGVHARREFSGRPGVGVGRGEQHSATAGTSWRNLGTRGQQRTRRSASP